MNINVSSVIVTYNPDINVLKKSILALKPEVCKVYLIDNSEQKLLKDNFDLSGFVEIINAEKNEGIAKGFNIGIKAAQQAGYKYIILLDQDSIIPRGLIEQYIKITTSLMESGRKIAAIGPRYRNPKSGSLSKFVRYSWFRNRYVENSESENYQAVPADFLISSGSFVDLSLFNRVGMMDERLFIDHVDTEWCFRAASKGYRCYGAPDAILDHQLGERELKLWFLRWRRHPIHKPFRLYYIFRNSLLMYKMSHVPLKWISGDVLRLMRIFFIYLFFVESRRQSLRWILKGLADGFRGVTGPARS